MSSAADTEPAGADVGTGPGPDWWDDARSVLPAWITARLLVALAYVLAAAIADHYVAGGRAPAWRDGLFAWDGTWYRAIALHGYHELPLESVRFFPGYPLFGRPFSGLGSSATGLALLVVANVASFAFAVGLRRLTRDETGDEAWAERAGWLAALFPAAFVLSWAYAEPLFLLALVVAIGAARRGRWHWVVPAALVAGFTRPLGVVLAAALAVEVVRSWKGLTRPVRFVALAAVSAPVLATAAYLAWIGRTFGDWQLPFRVQQQLRGEDLDVLGRLARGVGDLFGAERFGDGLHTPFALVFVALAVVVARRLPASYTVLTAGMLLAALAADNLNSLERYGLNAFPLLVALAALLGTVRRERLALAVCGNGLLALAALAWLNVYVP